MKELTEANIKKREGKHGKEILILHDSAPAEKVRAC